MCTRLNFEKNNQLQFTTPESYYEVLGFLASSKRTSIHWENNDEQGAWGKEGRIHCLRDLSAFPDILQSLFTAGTGNILKRIICTDYINHIRLNHNFSLEKCQDISSILSTVPEEYLDAFNIGLNR